MKAKDAILFKSKYVQNGWRPLLSLGIHAIQADEDYPEFIGVVAISLFDEIYYFNSEEEVSEIDSDMIEEAERIKSEADIPQEYLN